MRVSPEVAELLFELEQAGVAVSLLGDTDELVLHGHGRPRPELVEKLRARKVDVLARLRGAESVHTVDDTLLEPSLQVRSEGSEEVEDAHVLRTPAQSAHSLATLAPCPDWGVIGAQPGHCGSCARAVDAASEWGEFMLICGCEPVAWWPTSPPLAVHIGSQCGAYLMRGEEVGRGWRAKGDRKAWGPLRPVPLEAFLPTAVSAADHERVA
jgi:hypothetical protein